MAGWTRQDLVRVSASGLLGLILGGCARGRPVALPTPGQEGILTPLREAPLPTPTTTPPRGGILRFNLPGEPVHFDLHQAGTSTDLWCLHPCFGTLLQFDPHDQTRMRPNFAER